MPELFLVTGEISVTHYMRDRPERYKTTRLVEAVDYADAEQKFKKYFEDKTVDYDVSYSVYNVEAEETIR